MVYLLCIIKKNKQTRQLNEYNILKFRNLLAKADYTSVLSAIDPNEAYNNVMQIYKSLFEISCPVKTTKINKKYIKKRTLDNVWPTCFVNK